MDFLVEMIFTVFIEGWLALMTLGIPKEEMSDKKQELLRKIAVILAAVISIAILVAVIFGIAFIVEDKNKVLGYVLLIGAITLSLFQIIFGIVRVSKKSNDS